MPMRASSTARATVRTRRFTYLLFFRFGRPASAGQLDDGHAEIGAVEAAGERDHSVREIAVEAVIGPLTVVRRVEPVRGVEAGGQVVPGDNKVREPLQRVGGGATGGSRSIDGHQERRLILLRVLQKTLTG